MPADRDDCCHRSAHSAVFGLSLTLDRISHGDGVHTGAAHGGGSPVGPPIAPAPGEHAAAMASARREQGRDIEPERRRRLELRQHEPPFVGHPAERRSDTQTVATTARLRFAGVHSSTKNGTTKPSPAETKSAGRQADQALQIPGDLVLEVLFPNDQELDEFGVGPEIVVASRIAARSAMWRGARLRSAVSRRSTAPAPVRC